MARLTLMVGPPGSGKSTLSHDMISNDGDHGAAIVRVSQDDQGRDGHMTTFEWALHHSRDIIVDRMNFDKNQRNRYLEPARKAGYETRIIVVHTPLLTCLERCNARVGHPTIQDSKSASKAVNFFFSHYERVSDDEANEVVRMGWVGQEGPKVIVCDLDGTLCNVEHRRHHVRPPEIHGHVNMDDPPPKFKKNWPAFFAGIPNDTINKWCDDLLAAFRMRGVATVFCSGRGDNERKATDEWLTRHGLGTMPLYMRNRQDQRKDDVVKEIILDFEILTRYNPYFMVDDRQQVVDMWRKRGFVCLQCDVGNF